jgi:hypothetical protein
MYEITQGTIISGLRSEKYSGINCFGVVISARCDLANCKIPKIYYLASISVDDWLLSGDGFKMALSQRISDLGDTLQTKLNDERLDWSELKKFTPQEFEKVVTDTEVDMKKQFQQQCIKDFKIYKQYTSDTLSVDEKKNILNKEKKTVTNYLLKVANGQIMHYSYIPQHAYRGNKCIYEGLIVDLQELEFISLKTAEILANCEMDEKSKELSEVEKQKYNESFFIKDPPGYALAESDITSPWIEYLMQRFSNSFTRIGVDGPQKQEVGIIVDRICDFIKTGESV